MENMSVFFDVLTPVHFIRRSAMVYPDKTAVVYNDLRYSYRQFFERVTRLGNALRQAGIERGDKVAFVCPNTPAMLEAHFAVPMIGAVLVSVNIRLASAEISYIINHSDSKAVFVDNEFAGVVKPIAGELKQVRTFVNICDISADRPLEGPEYEEFLAAASTEEIVPAVDDEYQNITINYTSGTTGLPKGVMYHHRGAYLNALGEMIETGFDSSSVYLWTLPMFHCNGWCFTWGVTAMGGTHVCLRKVVPEEIYRMIEKEKVTHLCAAPTILIGMSSFATANDLKLQRPLTIITAGAPPAPTIIQNMEAIGSNIIHVYGLTEVYGPHTVCARKEEWQLLTPGELAGIKSRQGVAYIVAMYVDVVDPLTMQPVPRNGTTIGEIVMRGNNVMMGYYKDPKATAIAFEGGWFHSGDLAVVHPDNYIQIMDRKKDIIISGGENISTVEVENVIYRHPDVLEVAVVAVPDEKWGEVAKAFVVAKEGTAPTAESIIAFCKEHLARFKAPKYVEFGALPKTATGKIQKFKLREREWQGREKRVN